MTFRQARRAPALLLVLASACSDAVPPNSKPRPRPPLDVKGIEAPLVVAPDQAGISDQERIIGVVVGSVQRAYLLRTFHLPGPLDPSNPGSFELLRFHVVNDVIENVPVTVTYCDLNDCTRVLTDPQRKGPLDVGVGGLRDGEMLLVVSGQSIPQSSQDIPLDDLSFELTT